MALLDLSAEIAILGGESDDDGFPGDAADRLIVATALHHGAGLITKDKSIRAFPKVHTIW